ncbi:recombinase family protein [Chloroflexota bacterium]
MKAVIYTRVSTDEQIDGYSLEAQEGEAQKLCDFKGWQIARIYSDPGRSGKTAIRPGFQAMIDDAEAGLFDVIVVHKLDRFSRSLLDTLSYLGRLERCGVSFISASEDFDFTTPFGKLMLAILGAFAQWYVDNLAAEVRKGKRQRAANGRWNGTLSFGYTTLEFLRKELDKLGTSFTAGTIEQDDYTKRADAIERALELYTDVSPGMAFPHPINRHGVELAYALYATGDYSYIDVAGRLNALGYRTIHGNLFSHDTMCGLLKSRFYLGEVSYVGGGVNNQRSMDRDWQPGEHEAIISQELFDLVQQKIEDRRTWDTSNHTAKARTIATFSGLLVCGECGSTFRYSGPRKKVNHGAYRDQARPKGLTCNRRPVTVRENVLEEQIGEILSELVIPEDWQQHYKTVVNKSARPADETHTASKAHLENRLTRLRQLFTMGDINEQEYVAQRDAINNMMPTEATVPDMTEAEQAIELLYEFDQLWTVATRPERNYLLKLLTTKLVIEDGHIAEIHARPILYTLVKFAVMSKSQTAWQQETTSRGCSGVDGSPTPSEQTPFYLYKQSNTQASARRSA